MQQVHPRVCSTYSLIGQIILSCELILLAWKQNVAALCASDDELNTSCLLHNVFRPVNKYINERIV